MALHAKIKQLIEKTLGSVDGVDIRSPRLVDDARRLWGRVQNLLGMNLLPEVSDPAPLELACYALQLPLRNFKGLPTGKLGRTNLRDRTDQAAEMLLTTLGDQVEEQLLDR